ncbi:MAG: DUF3775 domain-containing protein [Sphingomonadales bacterium]
MLNIDPETVCFIIVKARAFDELVAPSEQDSEDDPRTALEDYADNPGRLEIEQAIEALNIDAQLDLVALLWIGRGDYTGEDFDAARAQARSVGQRPMAQYLLGTPLLADYLEEGLGSLGYSCNDFEMGRL